MSFTDLIRQIKEIGLKEGDIVLVRASVSKIGQIEGGRGINSEKIIRALLDVIGENGTLVGLAFTKTFLFPHKHKNYIYDSLTPPITGGFASAMVKWPGSIRSTHPSNSFVAIGKHSEHILRNHDERASCFHPIEKIIDLDGKMMLIGCVKDSPGFSTVHLVQHHLGYSAKSILRNNIGVYFKKKDGRIALFKKKDIPGCSDGFSKFYSAYVNEAKLKTGWIGNAYSLLINAKDAYNIEYDCLKDNPKYALCVNPFCISCRGSLYYNIGDWPLFYLKMICKGLVKLISYRTNQ